MENIRILDKHRISYDFIRSVAIDCHALDTSAYYLFVDGTHTDGSIRTIEIYREKFSVALLNMAVTIRTLLYQNSELVKSSPDICHCGFYESENETDKACVSIKDVCDKIIHANRIDRKFEKIQGGDQNPITFITGTQSEKPWKLDISVSLFCQAILNWIDTLEQA